MDNTYDDDEVFAWQLIYCLFGVFFFLVGAGSIRIGLLTTIRRRFSALHCQIVDLQKEIREQQAQLAKISIMDEFAAHCRKNRIIEKLKNDHQTLVSKRDAQELSTSILWMLFGKAACTSLGFYLAAQSTDLILFRINSSNFYPFNFLLSYPCHSDDDSKTPVSLFCFLILTFTIGKIFYQRLVSDAHTTQPVDSKIT
ncbi:hypothetical protein M3Y98_00048800 [Aphelenchoides besseyi]|nr:hypothetical protein M3Y98_00048800 [Aphelenchoides besseyi]KAI6198957.1 hypothetical protein M3Y96_00575600 [Aphelenchoides besseyi]